jgi:hypothetical protein
VDLRGRCRARGGPDERREGEGVGADRVGASQEAVDEQDGEALEKAMMREFTRGGTRRCGPR